MNKRKKEAGGIKRREEGLRGETKDKRDKDGRGELQIRVKALEIV